MTLLTRLIAPVGEEEKLPVHQFMAALSEYKRGAPGVNLASIAAAFNLSAQEQTALQTFLTNLNTDAINRDLVHDVLLLGEAGIYSVAGVQNRLGV